MSSLANFLIAATFAHRLDPGIDSGSAEIFSTGFIGKLRGQCPLGKNAGKNGDKIKTLRANTLLCVGNTGIMDTMATATQLLGQSKSYVDVRLPIQRRDHNISHDSDSL